MRHDPPSGPQPPPLPPLAEDVRELIDSIQDVFYRVDARDTIVSVSRSALRVLGYERMDQIVGRPASSFWASPQGRAAFRAALEERGELNDREVELLRADGGVVHVATTVRVIRDASGATIGYQGIWRDIGERKRAEEALRLSEEKFAKVFLLFPDTITISRRRDGKILDVNPGFERVTRWSREEAIGRSTVDLELWADQRQRDAMVATLTRDGEVLDGEIAFRRRDGALRQGIYSARSIRIAGEPCLVFVMRDVTERRAAEAALRLQEKRLAQALEGAELGTWDLVVPTGRVVVNARWAEMLGLRHEEVTDAYAVWQEGLHPDDVASTDAALRAHQEGLVPAYEAEFRLRHRDGHWVWILAKGRVLERDAQGRPLRMCGTHLDIGERKRLEAERDSMQAQLRQAQKLEAVGQIAGGVAHDFNNLLTVQLSSLQLLAEVPGLPAEARELLGDVEAAARAATNLTRQLLAFGRRQVLQREPVELGDFLADLAKMLRRVLREDVRIALDAGGGPHWIHADRGMLQQVVMNLAINAQDAMPSGGVLAILVDAVELAAGASSNPDAAPGRFVRLTVADTGHGMDEATQRRAFEPFFTTKSPGKGTGLGLATAYGIVKQHGGFIELRSAPGDGAELRVHWPCAAPEQAAPRRDAPPAVARGAGETVLLVEDAPAVRRMVAALLARLGYGVVEAADAEGALRAIRAPGARVDLVLSDVVMPGIGGLELARRLRRDFPALPVVLMSGYSADLATGGFPEGVRFVAKPIELATLAAVVREASGRAPA